MRHGCIKEVLHITEVMNRGLDNLLNAQTRSCGLL